jgi:hypothetical protein
MSMQYITIIYPPTLSNNYDTGDLSALSLKYATVC